MPFDVNSRRESYRGKFDGKIGRNYHGPMVGSPKSVFIHTDGQGCHANEAA